MIPAEEHKDRTKQTRYFKNSDKLSDNDIDKYIASLRTTETKVGEKQSISKRNLEQKHMKMLSNYDKYQDVWMKNLDRSREARNRLNDREVTKIYLKCSDFVFAF